MEVLPAGYLLPWPIRSRDLHARAPPGKKREGHESSELAVGALSTWFSFCWKSVSKKWKLKRVPSSSGPCMLALETSRENYEYTDCGLTDMCCFRTVQKLRHLWTVSSKHDPLHIQTCWKSWSWKRIWSSWRSLKRYFKHCSIVYSFWLSRRIST